MSKYTNATVSLKLPFSHNVHFSSTSVVSTITQLHRRSKGGYLGKYLVGQILFLNIVIKWNVLPTQHRRTEQYDPLLIGCCKEENKDGWDQYKAICFI